jgi:predicted TIM-barrel fold metal-dependent hydrolase
LVNPCSPIIKTPIEESSHMIARRTFIQGTTSAVFAATTSGLLLGDSHAQQAPNSTGSEPAKLKAPPNACDCHHHIYDAARFPVRAGSRVVPNARVEDYRLLQKRIGTSRNIVVTPIGFPAKFDENLVTLDAIKQGGGNARGVAIVSPAISDAELTMLHEGGVRGIRFSSTGGSVPPAVAKEIEPLAKRIADLGWHVQINIEAGPILELAELWNRLPATLVIDHMGHIRQPQGVDDPAFKYILELVDKGRTWVKLSITYDSSKDGPPGYADVNRVGAAYVKAAPDRMVWGSNWPHPNETTKPDDALLFDQLAQWAPDERIRNRILVDNPAMLYGFPKA